MREDDRRADPQPASRRRRAKDDRLSGFRDFTQKPARALVKRFPFIRQSKALRSTLDQAHAEVLFEFGDPARQRSLGTTKDAGSATEYVSIKYTARLAEAGIEPSGGSYDNALAETLNGPYKAEVIHRRAPR